MLYQLGHGLYGRRSVIPAQLSIKSFDFTTALPSEFTFTRSGATATYRDSNGDWQAAAANAPRFDHDVSGNPLGLRFEPPRTNTVNHDNFSPTTIGDISVVSGDGVASVVSDTSALATATIDGSTFTDLQNGNAIQLTGGTGGTTFQISPQVGDLSNRSFRVVARAGSATYSGNVKMSRGGAPGGQVNVSTTSYTEIIGEALAQDFTTRFLAVFVVAGQSILLVGAQLETADTISSPIITSGVAGATRNREVCRVSSLTSATWFNQDRGCMIGEAVFKNLGFDNQYIFHAGTNGSVTNALGLYSANVNGQMKARDVLASSNKHNDYIHKPIIGKRFPSAISWQDGSSIAVAGPMTYNDETYTGTRSSMDDLYVGGLPYNSAMDGWVKALTVYTSNLTLTQMGAVMFPDSESYKAIDNSGQSNAEGHFQSQETVDNGGEIAAVAQMDAVWTTTENWYVRGGVSGSALIYANNATDHWLVTASGADGTCLTRWKNIMTAFGIGNIKAIRWDQGASDSGSTQQEIYDNTLEVFTRMRTFLGADIPVIIAPIASRADQTADAYNKVKRAQEALATDFAWIHLSPPQNKVTFGSDNIHLSNASYGDMATRQTRKILSVIGESITGAVDAPEVLTASRVSTAVTVPVTFPSGITAITPTSAIAGFRFFDDAAEIAITAATYAAGNITLTLNSTPSGVETLYYGYGGMYVEIANVANFPVGNDAYTLGLQNAEIVL